MIVYVYRLVLYYIYIHREREIHQVIVYVYIYYNSWYYAHITLVEFMMLCDLIHQQHRYTHTIILADWIYLGSAVDYSKLGLEVSICMQFEMIQKSTKKKCKAKKTNLKIIIQDMFSDVF